MSKTILILLIFSFSSVLGQENHDYTILTYSQVGYNSKLPKQAMIQHTDSLFLNASSTFSLHSLNNNKKVYTGEIKSKGKKWNKYWWEADFSAIQKTGEYYLTISANGKINSYKSDKDLPITIGEDLLWNKTWYATALAHLHIRDSLSYKLEGGWKDC